MVQVKTLFGRDVVDAFNNGEKVDVVEGYNYVVREFNTQREADAYLQGMSDMYGWLEAYTLFDESEEELINVVLGGGGE